MNYQKIYNSIMERAKISSRVKSKSQYYEKHHVIPDFMFLNRGRNGPKGHLPGNPNDPSNIVLLTEREHILAHILLAKSLIFKRYFAQAASAVTWFFTKVVGDHPRQLHRSVGAMRKYEKYRAMGLEGISMARSGNMPCVDAITRISVGSQSTSHPKVLSGEWMHHSKGIRQSKEQIEKTRLQVSGLGNPRSSGITNEEILETYIWLTLQLGGIPGFQTYRKWYKLNFCIDFPKSLSSFRFNSGKDLYPLIESATGFTHIKVAKWSHKIKLEEYMYDKN